MISRRINATDFRGAAVAGDDGALSLLSLSSPAYFLNVGFEIKWVNQLAHKSLFNSLKFSRLMEKPYFRVICESTLSESPLLLEPALRVHLSLAKRRMSEERFTRHLGLATRTAQGRLIHDQYRLQPVDLSQGTPALEACALPPRLSGTVSQVCGITFREGTLFLIESLCAEPLSSVILDRRQELLNEVTYF